MRFDYIQVWGFEAALRGMRNPLNSHSRSDSVFGYGPSVVIGEKDMELCQKLICGGSEHRKFLRMIHVQMDITAERFWWSEFDTYSVGVTSNSQSTMHTIHRRDLTEEDFGLTGVIGNPIAEEAFYNLLEQLNRLITEYRLNRTVENLLAVKELLPESFLQTRTVDFTYEALFNIIAQREHHRLPHWNSEFVKMARALPYSKQFQLVRVAEGRE